MRQREPRGRGADPQRAEPVRARDRARARTSPRSSSSPSRTSRTRARSRTSSPRRCGSRPRRSSGCSSSTTSRRGCARSRGSSTASSRWSSSARRSSRRSQSEMEKGQREYFLRQQLKAIQEELGEGDEQQAEVNELRERADAIALPEDARKAVDRELSRLEKLPPAAAEYGVIRTYLEWILDLPWDQDDRGQPRPAPRAPDPRRGPLRPREGEGADRRVPRGLEAEERRLRADPLLRRAARRRQDLARPLDRAHARAQVRPHLGRRRPRRGRDPRPPAHVHRRDAGDDRPRPPRRRVAQPGVPRRRDRQDGRRLPRRPGERDARGARPGAARDLPRPLPRPAVRPLAGAVRLHREPARDDPAAAPRPHGRDRALRATPRTRRSRSRGATSSRSSSKAHGLERRQVDVHRERAAHRDPRVHARGRRARGSSGGSRRSAARPRSPSPRARRAGPGSTRGGSRAWLGPRRFHAEARRRTADAGVATGLAVTAVGGDVLFVEATAYPGRGAG